MGGPKPGPSGWAQAGPMWVGPRRAQVGGPKLGPSGPKLGPSQKFGTQKIQKIKILKIKIRSAQNVGKVWISRKKILLAPFGPIWANFLRGPEKCKKKIVNFCLFSLVGQWALFTRFGPMGLVGVPLLLFVFRKVKFMGNHGEQRGIGRGGWKKLISLN